MKSSSQQISVVSNVLNKINIGINTRYLGCFKQNTVLTGHNALIALFPEHDGVL